MKYLLDKHKNVIPCPDESLWRLSTDIARKNRDHVVGHDILHGLTVFTVFMGYIIEERGAHTFETTVFKNNSDGENIYHHTSGTWRQAHENHRAALQWVRESFEDGLIDDHGDKPPKPLLRR